MDDGSDGFGGVGDMFRLDTDGFGIWDGLMRWAWIRKMVGGGLFVAQVLMKDLFARQGLYFV